MPAIQHRLQHTALTSTARALRGDERQHISRPDLIRRLTHHREEHLQVVRGCQHRIWPAPPAQELQIDIGQRHPDPDNQPAETVIRTDHTKIGSRHSKAPLVTHGTASSRLAEMTGRSQA
jgi:hypothetical protein